MMEGWFCPRCKRVNAPWVSQCTCHETITTNTTIAGGPITGDPPFTWPNDLNWATCCDTTTKKAPTTLYSSDKTTSVTGVCSCSNKTESLNGKMPN